jgi:hypothetical protein
MKVNNHCSTEISDNNVNLYLWYMVSWIFQLCLPQKGFSKLDALQKYPMSKNWRISPTLLVLHDVFFLGPFPYDAMNTPANEHALFWTMVFSNKSLFVPYNWQITALAWWKYPYCRKGTTTSLRRPKNEPSCTF